MQPKVLKCFPVIAAITIFAISSQLAEGQQETGQPAHYYVFNLGDPGGGNTAAAASINNIGWIAGDSYETGNANEHAFLWVGTPVDLGTLGGPNSAVAWPNKNNRGQIAGIAETADMNPLNEAWSCAQANFPTITNHVCFGFMWEDGVMTVLPPLAGGIDSYAAGINSLGQVAGWAENGVHDPTCNNTPPVNQVLQFEAAVWGPKLGEMTQLSPLAPDPDSAATAINDKGQVVGISGLCANAVGGTSAEHAVLWETKYTPPIDLGNFDGGLAWNTPTALNNRGQVVGFGNQHGSPATAFNPIGFYWDHQHGIQPIPPIGDDKQSWAWGINRHGQVVGQSFNLNTGAARAFLYQNGRATDLNTLIQPNSSLQLLLANDVNDEGEIVGFASDTTTGATVAFLAVPVYGGNQQLTRAENDFRNTTLNESVRRPLAGTFSRFAIKAIQSR
jgi:probable HAF family extracellular repeat protein